MLTTKQVIEIVQFDDKVRDKVATEMTGSLPIPIIQGRHLRCLAFYFARSGLPPRTDFDLYPPTWLADIDWDDGVVHSIKEMEPKDFGFAGSRFQVIAKVSYFEINKAAAQKGLGDVEQRGTALAAAYDILLPSWREDRKPEGSAVRHFLELFHSIVEPPFLPVYSRIGTQFFSWLKWHVAA